MKTNALEADFEMILASLRQDFIVEAKDKLDMVDSALDAIENEHGSYENNLLEIQRLVHSIKGGAGSFGFQSISRIAHAFEDFMEVLRAAGRLPVRDSRQFVAVMYRIFESGQEPDDEETVMLLDSLPAPRHPGTSGAKKLRGKAIVLMPLGLQRKIMAQELAGLGFRVSIADDPVEVIDVALSALPDIVVTTMQLSRMSGLDVARALSVIERTAHIKVAVLTADDVEHHAKDLPDSVRIVHKGPTMAKEFLGWLRDCRII